MINSKPGKMQSHLKTLQVGKLPCALVTGPLCTCLNAHISLSTGCAIVYSLHVTASASPKTTSQFSKGITWTEREKEKENKHWNGKVTSAFMTSLSEFARFSRPLWQVHQGLHLCVCVCGFFFALQSEVGHHGLWLFFCMFLLLMSCCLSYPCLSSLTLMR